MNSFTAMMYNKKQKNIPIISFSKVYFEQLPMINRMKHIICTEKKIQFFKRRLERIQNQGENNKLIWKLKNFPSFPRNSNLKSSPEIQRQMVNIGFYKILW